MTDDKESFSTAHDRGILTPFKSLVSRDGIILEPSRNIARKTLIHCRPSFCENALKTLHASIYSPVTSVTMKIWWTPDLLTGCEWIICSKINFHWPPAISRVRVGKCIDGAYLARWNKYGSGGPASSVENAPPAYHVTDRTGTQWFQVQWRSIAFDAFIFDGVPRFLAIRR